MVQRLTQGALYEGIRGGFANRGSSSRNIALKKLGLKKRGQGLKEAGRLRALNTKKSANKFMRQKGVSLSQRQAVLKRMFGSKISKAEEMNNTPKPKAGLFKFGAGKDKNLARIKEQFGGYSAGSADDPDERPTFTSGGSSHSGGVSSGRRPSIGKLY